MAQARWSGRGCLGRPTCGVSVARRRPRARRPGPAARSLCQRAADAAADDRATPTVQIHFPGSKHVHYINQSDKSPRYLIQHNFSLL